MRRTLDYYAHRAFTSKQNQNETISQWERGWTRFAAIYKRSARKHMEDLARDNAKRKGGGNIIDLFIRAYFIQRLQNDRIKTIVKVKGNVNTPMAKLVEFALEEENAIKSEKI